MKTSSTEIEVIKEFKIHRGRPRSALLDKQEQHIKENNYTIPKPTKECPTFNKWKQDNHERVYISNKLSYNRRRDHFKQCEMIVLVLKELLKLNEVQLPQEVKNLIDKIVL